jgi:two-component system sensor histidine kinase PilS (NtrC family)
LPPARLQIIAAADTGDGLLEIRVDPTQLQQVVWNLCQNASTHGAAGDTGADTVELRYGRLASTARPYLEIADRGPGIAAEDTERVFEPFFTAERYRAGSVPGARARAGQRRDAAA